MYNIETSPLTYTVWNSTIYTPIKSSRLHEVYHVYLVKPSFVTSKYFINFNKMYKAYMYMYVQRPLVN